MENSNVEFMRKAVEEKIINNLNEAMVMIDSDADMYKRINATARVLNRANLGNVKTKEISDLILKLTHKYNCVVNDDIIDSSFLNYSLTRSCLVALNNIVDKNCDEYKRTLEMCFNIADIESVGAPKRFKFIFVEVDKLRKEHGVK